MKEEWDPQRGPPKSLMEGMIRRVLNNDTKKHEKDKVLNHPCEWNGSNTL